MCIRNVAIVTVGIFHEELLLLFFAVCNFLLSGRLNFVGQSVLYSGAYLWDCYATSFTRHDRLTDGIS